jgi:hypothetical protein
MEELLRQFSNHLRKKISDQLADRVDNYVNNVMSQQSSVEHDITEHEIKIIISNFFQSVSDENTIEISERLYNKYIEEDDASLICALKLFIRTYEYYYQEKLKRLFFKWRFKVVSKNLNNTNSSNSEIINRDSQNKNQKNDVFNKLYSNAKSKQDEKLLGVELKRISEMNECTFRPNLKSLK